VRAQAEQLRDCLHGAGGIQHDGPRDRIVQPFGQIAD
jgi:hypothetical protein